jgi:hypothetical protein
VADSVESDPLRTLGDPVSIGTVCDLWGCPPAREERTVNADLVGLARYRHVATHQGNCPILEPAQQLGVHNLGFIVFVGWFSRSGLHRPQRSKSQRESCHREITPPLRSQKKQVLRQGAKGQEV